MADTPKYTGIRTYRDPQGLFMFRYPSAWHLHDLADGRNGIMVSPQQDPKTWFAAWSVQLQDAVTAEDMEILREGIEEGLWQFSNLDIESTSDDTFENLIRFQRTYTFELDGVTRKRRARMLYVYRWLIVMLAEGETVAEYDYWHLMLHDCFDSFDLAPELWFASKRELFTPGSG